MATIEELVVRAKPEGLEDTSEGFGEMQEDLEDVEGQMEDTTGGIEDLQGKWMGAMNAIVAGMAVATAGLLTQVPVVGEAMGGLGAIVDGLAYQLDQQLRPYLSGVTDEFYSLSNEIYKSDGVLEGLDAVASKIGELSGDAIEFAIEEDVLEGGVEGLLTLVFPKLGKGDILDTLFSFNLSGAAVLTALFGSSAIATSKILSFMLPASISATAILAFVLPVIATAAVLSHVFDINMTKTAILGAIFAGVIITGALIMGAISWPVIAGAAIIGTLFAGVVITAEMVLDELFGPPDPDDNLLGTGRTLPQTEGTRSLLPGGIPESQSRRDKILDPLGVDRNPDHGSGVTIAAYMDGRDLTENTGRYRSDATTRRGRGP